MEAHDFSNLIFCFVELSNIKIAHSCKITENTLDYDRINFILYNVSKTDLLFLCSCVTNNNKIYEFINNRFSENKAAGIAFTNTGNKIYIENNISDLYFLESFEWEKNCCDQIVSRNYKRYNCLDIFKILNPLIYPYLDFNFLLYREEKEQYYVKFKCNGNNLIHYLETRIISVLLLLFDQYYKNDPGHKKRKMFTMWLLSKKHLQPSWLQFNKKSFTIYVR